MQQFDVTPEQPAVPHEGAVERPPRAISFLLVLLELLLLAAAVYLFDIEDRRHFFPVLCVMIGGFAVHAWLPARFRVGFFALLSAGCIPFVLGIENGLLVLAIGGVLIGICYLPTGLWTRVLLLVAVAGCLVSFRARWPLAIWPVLGSMFMFRLIVYVYSTRKETIRPPLSESLAYFFMVPNPCFPLFPVVDYKTFRGCWYNANEWDIYQRGVSWIVRGITHLLLYRYIKSHLVPEPYELYDAPHIAVFMAANYALYLRVSGQFHLITGLLHLFGFNLPRTHDHYFLASSFTDIWRRINIYWKDFMMKLFFFPTYYALHGRGVSAGVATVAAVMWVFVGTWLLHSWQTFWLLGRFPLTVNDACLWLGVGVCVAVNALLDSRRRKRSDGVAWWDALSLSARTVGMFSLVSLFWACWTNSGFPSLVAGVLQRPGAVEGLLVVCQWLVAAVVVGAGLVMAKNLQSSRGRAWPTLAFRDSAALHAAGLGLVVVFASPWFGNLLERDMANAIADFRSNATANAEALNQVQGYYEDLNAAAIQAGPLMTAITPQDESRRAQAAGFQLVSRPADLYQETELIPGVVAELSGSLTTINQFGMRDRRSITLNKPAGTIRIAIVGSSVVMGYGVADEEVFTRVFEDRLNAERSDKEHHYEVLNFGVGQQWASQRLVRIQRQVLGFEPDAIYYVAHQNEFQALAGHIARLVAHRLELPSRHLDDVVRQVGITPDMPPGAIESILQRQEVELLSAVYRSIVDECRTRGIVPVWIYLPIPGSDDAELQNRLQQMARAAGFVACDLSFWSEGRDLSELFPAAEEQHPHAGGHRLIADALMTMLKSHPEALPHEGTRR